MGCTCTEARVATDGKLNFGGQANRNKRTGQVLGLGVGRDVQSAPNPKTCPCFFFHARQGCRTRLTANHKLQSLTLLLDLKSSAPADRLQPGLIYGSGFFHRLALFHFDLFSNFCFSLSYSTSVIRPRFRRSSSFVNSEYKSGFLSVSSLV